jgi:hypothetical protein
VIIEYSIWQGPYLISVNNKATDIKEVDQVIATLNDSEIGKRLKFFANVMKVEAGGK